MTGTGKASIDGKADEEAGHEQFIPGNKRPIQKDETGQGRKHKYGQDDCQSKDA